MSTPTRNPRTQVMLFRAAVEDTVKHLLVARDVESPTHDIATRSDDKLFERIHLLQKSKIIQEATKTGSPDIKVGRNHG